jgi:hypothetical protein
MPATRGGQARCREATAERDDEGRIWLRAQVESGPDRGTSQYGWTTDPEGRNRPGL